MSDQDVHMKKTVKFSDQTLFIFENPQLSQALREARQSDYQKRLADKIRYFRLLTPILDDKHRLIARFRQLNLTS
jgi:hypothetical protein